MADIIDKNDSNKPFDLFELLTAILLGLAAVGAAVAGHQNNLWGGAQSEYYSEAATLTTKAANLYSEGVADLNLDYSVDLLAKKEILEGLEEEGDYRARKFEIASNLYTRYLSNEAYEELDLPKEFHGDSKEKNAKYKEQENIDEETLIDSVESDLGESYVDDMLKEANQEFEKADKIFVSGRQANDYSDQFSLIQVIYTISLFFAGLALVFKTKIRWGFLAAGGLVFAFGSIMMFGVPWM